MVTPVDQFGGATPQRGPRPATVTTAAFLQGAAVVMLLAIVALAWFARAQNDGWAEQAASLVPTKPGELEGERSANLVIAIVGSVLAGIPALWLAATLWPMLRGANVARILAAVAAFGIPGLGLLMTIGSCLSGALLFGLLAGAPIEDPAAGGYDDVPIDFPADSPFQQKLWDLQGSGPRSPTAYP